MLSTLTVTRPFWRKRAGMLQRFYQSFDHHQTKRLSYRISDLAEIFVIRQSLRLELTDSYLAKVWSCSIKTVQRTLADLEKLHLLKRFTDKPRFIDGRWIRRRVLCLILPSKKTASFLNGHDDRQAKLSLQKEERKDLTKEKSTHPKMCFADYLMTRQGVSRRAWFYWMRKWGAIPSSFGYLHLVHQLIKNRADILESILFDARDAKIPENQNLVGFIVEEIKART